MNLAPVDWVSHAIVAVCQYPQSLNEAFHLVNADTILWTKLSHLIWASYQLESIPKKLKQQLEKLETPVDRKIWWEYLQQQIEQARKINPVKKREFF
jgi:hypothetical protein